MKKSNNESKTYLLQETRNNFYTLREENLITDEEARKALIIIEKAITKQRNKSFDL